LRIGSVRWDKYQEKGMKKMKYGFISFGKLRPDIMGGGPESINKAMDALIKIAEKHEIMIKTYGFPYGVSENFVVVYESEKELGNYNNFLMEVDLPYTDARTHQVIRP
jgi:hypothetical protein